MHRRLFCMLVNVLAIPDFCDWSICVQLSKVDRSTRKPCSLMQARCRFKPDSTSTGASQCGYTKVTKIVDVIDLAVHSYCFCLLLLLSVINQRSKVIQTRGCYFIASFKIVCSCLASSDFSTSYRWRKWILVSLAALQKLFVVSCHFVISGISG